MTKNNEKQTVLPPIPDHWITANGIPQPRAEDIPRRIVVRKSNQHSGHQVPSHSHGWGQLLFLTAGLVQVKAIGSGDWIVPPQRAVWIPAYIEHEVHIIHSVKMRNVYISPTATHSLPNHCMVINVSPLLRELIITLAELETLYDEQGASGRLVDVFLDRLKVIEEVPLHLAEPKSKALLRISNAIRTDPSQHYSMEYWANELGLSSRTLARRFNIETGMTYGQWRQQAKLLNALQRISQGDPVANIALDLGYQSQSAFIQMFKKALGKTPGQYFNQE